MQKLTMHMHNTYTIYKIYQNNKTKITTFTNIVLNQLLDVLGIADNIGIHSISFGTGTAEPVATDTNLTKPLWVFDWNDATVISYKKAPIIKNGLLELLCTCKVPATSNYVGTVTELGISFMRSTGYKSSVLGTKALIKDTEGNPIAITKTDTEELLIEVHMQLQLSGSEDFEWNPYWYYAQTSDNSNANSIFGTWNLQCFGTSILSMLPWWPDSFGAGYTGNRIYPNSAYNKDDKTVTVSGGRFGVDNAPNQVYVNAIALIVGGKTQTYKYDYPGIYAGWWKFPNKNIFPQTTLNNMSVGTGDGNTKEFTPPLNLWVKDSEKIYIDGVLKTRDVDYSCDHKNNLSLLFGVMPSAFVKMHNALKHSDDESKTDKPYIHPFNKGTNMTTDHTSSSYTYTFFNWNKDNPLIWELLEDPQIGIEIDHIVIPSLDSKPLTYLKGLIMKVSYSNDLNDWTEVFTFTETANNRYTTEHRITLDHKVSAKYWKIEVPNANCQFSISSTPIYMYCKGSPIVFKEAPANGAIITMDADIDRPMKNSNFILDCNPSFQLS